MVNNVVSRSNIDKAAEQVLIVLHVNCNEAIQS